MALRYISLKERPTRLELEAALSPVNGSLFGKLGDGRNDDSPFVVELRTKVGEWYTDLLARLLTEFLPVDPEAVRQFLLRRRDEVQEPQPELSAALAVALLFVQERQTAENLLVERHPAQMKAHGIEDFIKEQLPKLEQNWIESLTRAVQTNLATHAYLRAHKSRQQQRLIGRQVPPVARRVLQERVLCLVGAAGVGKTALSLEVAYELLSHFKGAFFATLRTLHQIAEIWQELGEQLKLTCRDDGNWEGTVRTYLRGSTTLLVLDNCEQIPGIAAIILSLQEECPQLSLLATSRIPLDGIQALVVEPLSDTDTEALLKRTLRRLVDRGELPENWQALKELHGGIPLLIEAVAGALQYASVDQLLDIGPCPFAAIDDDTEARRLWWMYSCLSKQEKQLFRFLGLPVLSFDGELVQVLLGDEYDGYQSMRVLKRLLTRQLVHSEPEEPDGARWYYLLPPVQRLAQALLKQAPAEMALGEKRCAHYYERLAYSLEDPEEGTDFKREQHLRTLRRLDRLWDDTRLALAWWQNSGREDKDIAAQGVEFAINLTTFWEQRQLWREGELWLRRMRNGLQALPPDVEARRLTGLGNMLLRLGQRKESRECKEQSLTLYRELEDHVQIGVLLSDLGAVAFEGSELETAHLHLTEAVEVLRRHRYVSIRAEVGYAKAINNLGMTWGLLQGDFDKACEYLRESLQLKHDRLATAGSLGETLLNLAVMTGRLGEFAEAMSYLDQAETLFIESGMQWAVAYVVCGRGDIWCRTGALDQAEAAFHQAAKSLWELRDKKSIASCVEGLVQVAAHKNDWRYVTRLWAVAEWLRQRYKSPRFPVDQVEFEQLLRQAEDAFQGTFSTDMSSDSLSEVVFAGLPGILLADV
ncbi:ATP-binding protein [Armatimonas rosea]|uniref:Putative ATPase n=1 Tax=Armatimonas rosea TaxID=685828 RepID=A0A7W9SRJ4_ARMRO|nr:tetratricopeptide repeat protein [Armatimonas rosea]MBB6050758.1 putative ATPase [Armatimonas rosea]